jgi:hypothetical protein
MSALASTSLGRSEKFQRRMCGQNSFTDKRFSPVLRGTRPEQVPQVRAGGVNALNVRHWTLPWRNMNDAVEQQILRTREQANVYAQRWRDRAVE